MLDHVHVEIARSLFPADPGQSLRFLARYGSDRSFAELRQGFTLQTVLFQHALDYATDCSTAKLICFCSTCALLDQSI
jgi:hypothetical protein